MDTRLDTPSPSSTAAAPTAAPLPAARVQAVAAAFLTPARADRGDTLAFLAGATRFEVAHEAGEVAVAVAGDGPAVLLVHGWEGAASDLASLAQALLAAGRRVVALALPAHGPSSGERTSIPEAAQALRALGAALGPFDAAVAHSVGTAALVQAMAQGLDVGRVALFAAPAEYAAYARGFAHAAGLDASGFEALLTTLRARGVDVRAVSTPGAAATLRQPALFLHAEDDRVVPIADAERSVAAWPGARLHRLQGLGHRRLLDDAAAVQAAVAFVTTPHA